MNLKEIRMNRVLKYKMRQLSKRPVILIGLLFSTYLIWTYLYNNSDDMNNSEKLKLIEESIRSLVNQGPCQLPNLPVDSPEMMAFIKEVPPLNCGNTDDDWIDCVGSLCMIKKSVVHEKGKITCDVTDILRIDDFNVKYGDTSRISTAYTLRNSDYAQAACWTENKRLQWKGVILGIRERVPLPKKDLPNSHFNVLMYGFDSLSKNAFIRKLPKSYKYLTEDLNGDVLQGYNIVGDGTPQALIPILTGYTELELPETRKRYRNSQNVNVYPWIWNEYHKNGFVTAFNEDVPSIGTFSYRLNGFKKQPTDHYMRTFYLAIKQSIKDSNYCIGHKPGHQIMMDYTKNFMLKYRNRASFLFSFHGELSHDSINLVGVADDDLKEWLHDLNHLNILNNTVLILMSDHGNRFAEVRNTLQGKQEERLPFFSFVFPAWFKTKYRNEYEHFRENLNRLTTPFDIHATLEDLLALQTYGSISTFHHSRAISLLAKIPENRSCADAYIEPHWCACLNWVHLNDTSIKPVQLAVSTLINFINKYTEPDRNICEPLKLHQINWASRLKLHDALVKFKQNRDTDGFLADMSSNTKIPNEIYQIKVTLNPGRSIFEASVVHDIESNKFHVKLSDISRINKYGSQANCIYESNPELRKYCYCKNMQ